MNFYLPDSFENIFEQTKDLHRYPSTPLRALAFGRKFIRESNFQSFKNADLLTKFQNFQLQLGIAAYSQAGNLSNSANTGKPKIIIEKNNLENSDLVIIFMPGIHTDGSFLRTILESLGRMDFGKLNPSIIGIDKFYGPKNLKYLLEFIELAKILVMALIQLRKRVLFIGHSCGGIISAKIIDEIISFLNIGEKVLSILGVASPINMQGTFAKNALAPIADLIGFNPEIHSKIIPKTRNLYAEYDEVLINADTSSGSRIIRNIDSLLLPGTNHSGMWTIEECEQIIRLKIKRILSIMNC